MAEETKTDDSKTVRLVSMEGETVDVPVAVARMSELVKSMIEGNDTLHVIYIYFKYSDLLYLI